jgi:hypothetical protein
MATVIRRFGTDLSNIKADAPKEKRAVKTTSKNASRIEAPTSVLTTAAAEISNEQPKTSSFCYDRDFLLSFREVRNIYFFKKMNFA